MRTECTAERAHMSGSDWYCDMQGICLIRPSISLRLSLSIAYTTLLLGRPTLRLILTFCRLKIEKIPPE